MSTNATLTLGYILLLEDKGVYYAIRIKAWFVGIDIGIGTRDDGIGIRIGITSYWNTILHHVQVCKTTNTILLNKRPLKSYNSITDAIVAWYLLHAVLNFQYASIKYYLMMEIALGVRAKTGRPVKALTAFLSVYDITN